MVPVKMAVAAGLQQWSTSTMLGVATVALTPEEAGRLESCI